MSSLRYWLMDARTIGAVGVMAAAGMALFGGEKLKTWGGWLFALTVFGLVVWGLVWGVRRYLAHRASQQLENMVAEQAEQAVINAKEPAARADAEVLRERMNDAVKAIKSSKLGVMKGNAALYELPWYVIIGNPAAGKSTAILNSGLRFPFEDNRSAVIHGLGGTRNCDWYFTTEGIVLDTAGRYTVSAEDRAEWLTFLDLLKKHRTRAPINGIIIAASIAELSGSKPEFAIELAKNLRQRVQELTERLEVFAPVYVVFTKADLIAGFTEFFRGMDPSERENAWGATLPYDPKGEFDALNVFDRHFDELSDGLKDMSVAQMAMLRGREVPPGLLTLPMEFAAIKPALRTFIATLFEDNPYQFKPVFRGFYFTSALQEGVQVQYASERVARQFALQPRAGADRLPASDSSHFLLGLFRKVIFADKQLVKQYASPYRNKLRLAAFAGSVGVLAIALSGWTWSYTSNKQLVSNVAADLDKAVQLQADRVDLQSRVEALLVLQDRLEQLERYRDDHPLSMGLGLYQGEAIEAKLREEYFNGMRQLMLVPVSSKLENYLSEVVARRGELRAINPGDAASNANDGAAQGLYLEPSPTDTQDAYNALKTYLMLGDRSRVEATHLSDQLTRYWRSWLESNRGSMPREAMIRAASKLLSFYVAQSVQAQNWPQIDPKFTLVNDSRAALRAVMKGTPARDRLYADIKQRASTRFPGVTVATLLTDTQDQRVVAGSYQVPGTFTRQAWDEYIKDAINDAAKAQFSSTDPVLEETVQGDLTLSGSPEHISKELTQMYKQEYAREWRKFLQGVTVSDFGTFDSAVDRMNALGDPTNSPLRKLLLAVNEQTIWDNPEAANKALGLARKGVMGLFDRWISRNNNTGVQVSVDQQGRQIKMAMGPIGQEFQGLARLMMQRENNPPLLNGYFESLGKVRTRLNQIKNAGEPGPGARKLMEDTLRGESSELAETLRLVDEQMLNGLTDSQRQALRPLLLRPLIQTFAALVRPAEGEINSAWAAQVYEPFQKGIGRMLPFAADASVEAAAGDIAQIFGPDGAIAKFNTEALGGLVVRRGNTITPQRWTDLGINLRPELMTGYATWVAPVGGAPGGASNENTTVFEILPGAAVGVSEYTILIDGQQLRYRNTPPQWTTFTWPNPQGQPGAKVTALAADGRTIELINAPGRDGLTQLFAAAQRQNVATNHHRLTWSNGATQVGIELRIVSQVQAVNSGNGLKGLQLPAVVAGATPVDPSTHPTTAGTSATGTSATHTPVSAGAP